MTDHDARRSWDAFYAPMREQIAATPLPAAGRRRLHIGRPGAPTRQPGWRHPGRLMLGIVTTASMLVAAGVVVVVLALGATTGVPRAYAMTHHADGSITVTVNDLIDGIPQVNREFQRLGIPETVVPITAHCTSPNGSDIVMHPDPLHETNRPFSFTYTPQDASSAAPAGFHYLMAAMRLPNGKILDFIGAIKPPIPTCLPYNSTPSDLP